MNFVRQSLLQLVAITVVFVFAATAWPQSLSIASFNVESDDDTQPELVAEDFARLPPLHVWALQEVESQAALDLFTEAVSQATGYTYLNHLGSTGGRYGDFLAFIYLDGAFSDISFEELEEVGGSRHPLVMRAALLHSDEQQSAQPLILVNNHFQRGHAGTRRSQARRLRDWIAARPTEAIIPLGDFNFDYDFRGARQGGNRAFEIFATGGHISWPAHMCIERGNCPATGSQCNPNYNNMLDFIFLAGSAFDWPAITDLAFLDERYCRREDNGYSDHRPVIGQILIPDAASSLD